MAAIAPIVVVSHRYAALHRGAAPKLAALAERVLGEHGEAEDVVQEAFLRLTRDPVLERPDDEVIAWLRRVCLRLSFNRLRDTRRWRDRAAHGGRLLIDVQPDDPEGEALRADERARVRAVLAELPERQRNCLLLRHSGYRYAEIAVTLGIAPGSVGTTLARAERAFRAAIDPKP